MCDGWKEDEIGVGVSRCPVDVENECADLERRVLSAVLAPVEADGFVTIHDTAWSLRPLDVRWVT